MPVLRGSRPRTRIPVAVRRKDGVLVPFRLEVARGAEEQLKGLSDRHYLGPQDGMIFVADPPRRMIMTMADTLIPLDMLFVSPRGRVVRVYHNARPGSLAGYTHSEPVAAVVELRAGAARQLGIARGDLLCPVASRRAVGWNSRRIHGYTDTRTNES